MSLADIQRGWLIISLSPKRAFKAAGKVTQKHNRTPVGDKGLGRLGTIKLGSYVVIETHNQPNKPGHRVSFFWSDCVSGVPLSEVGVQLAEVPPLPGGVTGTKLFVYGLNDLGYWQDRDSRDQLEIQLSTLISPFRDFEGFIISIEINGAPLTIQSAQSYLEQAQSKFGLTWLSLKHGKDSPLEIDGQFKLSLFKTKRNDDFYEQHVAPDHGAALLKYLQQHKTTKPWGFRKASGQWFLTFTQSFSREELGVSFNESRFADPGPFLGSIYSFDYDESKSTAVMGKAGLAAPAFIKDYTGVFVFRDNFRIRMGEDWLGLGRSWTEGSSYYGLKPKNTLGWIAIAAKDNAQLVEKSDREGFVENPVKRGFDHLTGKFRDTINDSLEALRRTYLEFKKEILNTDTGRPPNYASEQALKDITGAAKDASNLKTQIENQKATTVALKAAVRSLTKIAKDIPATSKTRKQIGEISGRLQEICDQIESARDQVTAFAQQLADLKRAAEVITEKLEQNDDQFRELYGMAAVGLAAQGLIHELQPCIDEMLYSAEQIKAQMKTLGIKNPRLFERVEITQTNAKAIGNRVRFLDPMMRTYRTKKEETKIQIFLAEFKKFKDATLAAAGIGFKIECDKDVDAKLNRGQLIQVFDNLVRNSEYWLGLFAKEHPKSPLDIHFEIATPFVRIWDTGFGIDKKIEEQIFELFVSAKPRGEGHGLGLFLARELLSENNAAIVLLPQRNKHGRRYIFQIDFDRATHG
jgi:signal transduction histidine kinase